MSDAMERWIASWWDDAPRPADLQPGQIWTVFHPDPEQEAPGTMAALLDVGKDSARVVPLHHDHAARTGCEPVLGPDELGFDGRVVAAVELAGAVSNDAFAGARYLGRATPAAVERLRQAVREVDAIVAALDDLKRREALAGPAGIPDGELARGFEAGILKLMPIEASFIEWADLHRALHFNLAPFYLNRKPDLTRQAPEAERNYLTARLDNLYHPETIYRAMSDLLAAVPEALKNGSEPAARSPIHPLFNQETHKLSADELQLLRALVYAKLNRWDDAHDCFRQLAERPGSDLGRRAVVWLSKNHNVGDGKFAREMAGRIAGPGPEASAEDVIREAAALPLHQFIRLENLDREIMRLWRMAEDRPPGLDTSGRP